MNSTVSERKWLTIPDLAEKLGITSNAVRHLIEDGSLYGMKRDAVFCVPDVFLIDNRPVAELKGTAVVLADNGFTNDEIVCWLLEDDDALAAAPIDALRAGRKAEVRRVAQALG